MPSAYIIANVDVTNPEQYEEYKKLSTIAMKAHGAEVCIRGGKVEVLDGRKGYDSAKWLELLGTVVKGAGGAAK